LKACRQDVLQETPDKFFDGQGAAFPAASVPLPVAKGHLTGLELAEAMVAQRHPKDVRSQIYSLREETDIFSRGKRVKKGRFLSLTGILQGGLAVRSPLDG
jgi:hypothetical protein